jgi:light-regulated signal transduction histidine kinase (bacteriophytochrome)
MMDMVNGVLAYSKLSAADENVEAIDLNETIRGVESDLEVLMQQKSASVDLGPLPVIYGVPVLIHQLFYNLINNSIKFSNAGVPPRIIITGEATATGMAKIVVADNGIGFEQEYAERIFKTFTRLNSKDNYEGTGLGLSLCKKIVERHGGSITAEGVEGDGARFIVMLPMLGR